MNSCSCYTKEIKDATLELGKLLRLVGDDTRLQVLMVLSSDGRHCVCEFGGHLKGTSQSLLSHHLADLRDAGLVQTIKQGLRVYYELTEHGRRVMSVVGQLKYVERSPK